MPVQPNRDDRDRCASILSCHQSSLRRSQVAVFPADGIGSHRVGAYLRFVNKAAPSAPQGPVLKPGTGYGNVLNLRE